MYHVVTRDDADETPENHSEPVDGRSARDKKERVLHTRIPAVLEAELKSVASALRVPVSNLVRTILEDAVAVADRATSQVEQGLERAARSVGSERQRLRERLSLNDPLADVVAYQPVTVAGDARCAKCAGALEAGDDAALAIQSRPGPPLFVCTDCLPKRRKG
jgi:hypothetical protein